MQIYLISPHCCGTVNVCSALSDCVTHMRKSEHMYKLCAIHTRTVKMYLMFAGNPWSPEHSVSFRQNNTRLVAEKYIDDTKSSSEGSEANFLFPLPFLSTWSRFVYLNKTINEHCDRRWPPTRKRSATNQKEEKTCIIFNCTAALHCSVWTLLHLQEPRRLLVFPFAAI